MEQRTWLDIDLDALQENYRTACSLTDARVTCVLKANAYGHGLVRAAQALREAGCADWAVSCGREALALRRAGIGGFILVMGASLPEEMPALVREHVTLTVSSFGDIRAAEAAGEKAGTAAHVHLKLDSGFHRLGFPCTEEAADGIANALSGLNHVSADGVYSHLGLVSRERDIAQHERFTRMLALLERRGITPEDRHLCDSIGLVRYPQWHMSRCRVGAMLFGMRPNRSEGMGFPCRETIAFRARVAQVTGVAAGEVIGYSEDVTDRPMRVATVCAGYGDGYPRRLSSGRGRVMIRGKLAPVVGLVCMDQLMADVTDISDCAAGDTATLMGGGVPFADVADWADTNRNECITILSGRPVRVYHQHGRVVTVTDDLLNERKDWP